MLELMIFGFIIGCVITSIMKNKIEKEAREGRVEMEEERRCRYCQFRNTCPNKLN